jgi:hypothetical protein
MLPLGFHTGKSLLVRERLFASIFPTSSVMSTATIIVRANTGEGTQGPSMNNDRHPRGRRIRPQQELPLRAAAGDQVELTGEDLAR